MLEDVVAVGELARVHGLLNATQLLADGGKRFADMQGGMHKVKHVVEEANADTGRRCSRSQTQTQTK